MTLYHKLAACGQTARSMAEAELIDDEQVELGIEVDAVVNGAIGEGGRQVFQTFAAGDVVYLEAQLTRFVVRIGAADTADFGPAVAPDPGRSLDNAGSTADAAGAELLADNHHCNSVLADAAARTAVRIL
jgi:hypothetical protein